MAIKLTLSPDGEHTKDPEHVRRGQAAIATARANGKFEAQAVLIDKAIYTFIAGGSDRFTSLLPGPAVAHPQEQFDDQTLKELR